MMSPESSGKFLCLPAHSHTQTYMFALAISPMTAFKTKDSTMLDLLKHGVVPSIRSPHEGSEPQAVSNIIIANNVSRANVLRVVSSGAD